MAPVSTSDPTDTALSPWVWVPLAFLIVCCTLFISIRRAHSRDIWERLVASYHAYSPFGARQSAIRLAGGGRPSQRLGTPARAPGDGEASDDSDDGGSDPELDDGDELPSSAPTPRRSAPQQAIYAASRVLDTLGWTGTVTTLDSGPARAKDAGIARAFWGIRKQDRTGGIRLGLGGNDDDDRPRVRKPPLSLGRTGTLPKLPASPARGVPPSPSATGNASLFDLGEEDGENDAELDAVELARDFELPTGHEHPLAWGGEGKGAARGMQRL